MSDRPPGEAIRDAAGACRSRADKWRSRAVELGMNRATTCTADPWVPIAARARALEAVAAWLEEQCDAPED